VKKVLELSEYKKMAPVLLYGLECWGDVLKDCPTQSYKAGTIIRMQGSEEGDVVIVKEGFAAVSVILNDGTESIQHISGPGSSYGYAAASSGLPYKSTMRAYTDCQCCIIPNKKVKYLVEHDPGFYISMLMIASMRGDIYFQRIILLAIPQSGIKLLYLLLGFAAVTGKEKEKGKIVIQLELTHQLLSEILHVSRVTVSRLMSSFARKEAVVKNGKYYELRLDRIEEMLS